LLNKAFRVHSSPGGRVCLRTNPERCSDAEEIKVQLTKMFTETLDPALVSPAVAFLAHESCPVSGELYTAGGGQVSRWFIGRTKGYFNRGLTIEDVAEHFGEIRDETDYTVMNDRAEEVGQVLTAVTGSDTTVK
jgi:hypothetical protein